jgi:hypothetical protein
MLPAVMRWNKPVNAARQALVAAAMGHQGEDAGEVLGCERRPARRRRCRAEPVGDACCRAAARRCIIAVRRVFRSAF